MNGERLSTTKLVLLIFSAAFILRLMMAFWLPQEVIWPDGKRYERVAINLIEGQGFGDLVDNRRSVPTQPLLIAAVYGIFGKSYLALRIVSAAIGAASCVLGSLLARQLFGSLAALFAGALLVAYPHLVYLSALFEYPQGLGILLMAGFLLSLLKFRRDERPAMLLLASISLGALVLTLPTVLLFVPIFALLVLNRDLKQSALRLAIIALGLGLTLGLWTVRNYSEYGRLMIVNAAGGANFWAANNETYAQYGKRAVIPACGPGNESTTYCHEHRAVQAQLRSLRIPRSEKVWEHERMAWKHGMQFVRESPSRFIRLSVKRFVQLWSPWPDAVHTGTPRGGSARDIISAMVYVPLALLALAGLVMSAKRHGRQLMPVYLFLIVFVIPLTIFLPTMRYRLPVDFLLAIFASVPLAHPWQVSMASHRGVVFKIASSAFPSRSISRSIRTRSP